MKKLKLKKDKNKTYKNYTKKFIIRVKNKLDYKNFYDILGKKIKKNSKFGIYCVENREDFEYINRWLIAKKIINKFLWKLENYDYNEDYEKQKKLAHTRTQYFYSIILENKVPDDAIKLSEEINDGKYNFLYQ